MEDNICSVEHKKLQKTISNCDSESVISDDSSSPKSVDSDYSFETTESSLEDEQATYTSDDSRASSRLSRQSSIVDGLLNEIYDRYHHGSRSGDSDNVTECSTTSFYSGSFELDERTQRWTRSQLNGKDLNEIRRVLDELNSYVTLLSGRLVRQLKRRDKNAYKLQRNFDILTAILQAVSLKRRIDTRIKFSFIPQSGKKGFRQWLDSFKAVSRLSQGVPAQWRRRLWLILAESKLGHLDWKKTCQFCFNERSNPDDDNLGAQIVKDLHRTGCSWFCEFETPEERAILKRVLLAYARWNKDVGYCQGFNVIAALILQVMDRAEEDTLKVMVYLIDFVLPANYFSNNLRSLSVDMAVLRELMKFKLPDLSDHLQNLQRQATAHDNARSNSYEPPLTNVFTMQWFLTLFATCLPEQLVLRVWDSILLEGSEVLLRVALAIWAAIGLQLEDLESADEFYGAMGRILPQIQEGKLINDSSFMNMVYNMAPFPYSKIVELREKYTYNIHPFASNLSPEKKVKPNQRKDGDISSDDDDDDVNNLNIGCLGLLSPQTSLEGGAQVWHSGVYPFPMSSPMSRKDSKSRCRAPVGVSDLEREYNRTRKMQQQAVVVFSQNDSSKSQDLREIPPAINHLFVVTRARRNKWKEHLQKERQKQVKLLPVREEDEERGSDPVDVNEHGTDAAEHLVGLFKGKPDESPTREQDRAFEENLVMSSGITQSSEMFNENLSTKVLKSSKEGNNFKIIVDSNVSNSFKTTRDSNVSNSFKPVRRKAAKTSLSIPKTDSALVLPDKKCIYPAKFSPFPGTRTKVSKNGLLYGKRTENEGHSKKQSFISGPPMPFQARTNR